MRAEPGHETAAGRHVWPLAALVVLLGAVLAPTAVPLFDGVGFPDQPYQYVTAPAGAASAPVAAPASLTTVVKAGVSTSGLTVMTAEQGPQLQLFIPLGAISGADGTATVTATPSAPTDQPAGATVDGNVYTVTVTNPAGPEALNARASQTVLILRATSAQQPGPTIYHRADSTQLWAPITTSRAGTDIYTSTFPALGEYAVAFTKAKSKSGFPVLPVVLLGVVAGLAVVVLVVRARSFGDEKR